jgi:hypothetical protein
MTLDEFNFFSILKSTLEPFGASNRQLQRFKNKANLYSLNLYSRRILLRRCVYLLAKNLTRLNCMHNVISDSICDQLSRPGKSMQFMKRRPHLNGSNIQRHLRRRLATWYFHIKFALVWFLLEPTQFNKGAGNIFLQFKISSQAMRKPLE